MAARVALGVACLVLALTAVAAAGQVPTLADVLASTGEGITSARSRAAAAALAAAAPAPSSAKPGSDAGTYGCPVAAPRTTLPTPLPAALAGLVANLPSQFLDKVLTPAGALSGSLALVYGDQTLYAGGVGKLTPDAGAKDADADTLYRMGSVSKVFTSTMLQVATERGVAFGDEPVSKYLPDYAPQVPGAATPHAAADTTLEQLGSHQSGLPRQSPCTFGDCNISTAVAMQRLRNYTLLRYPGERPSYSNVGFAVLAAALEEAMNTTWREFVAKEVFEPIGMARSAYLPAADDGNVAAGYVGNDVAPLQDYGFEAPAGQLFSSANDMAKFMKMLLGTHKRRGETQAQILAGSTLRRWLRRRVWVDGTQVPPGYVLMTSWGAPWEVSLVNSPPNGPADFLQYEIVGKDGSVPGYNAHLLLQPELGLGMYAAMAVAPNASRLGNFDSTTAVAMSFQLVPVFQAAVDALNKGPTLPPNADDYCGWFNLTTQPAVGLFVTVNKAAGVLELDTAGQPTQQLQWLVADAFTPILPTSLSCGSLEGGITNNIGFVRGGDGRVVSLEVEGAAQYPFSFARTNASCSMRA